jgi:Mg-chelatase subunit ChlD
LRRNSANSLKETNGEVLGDKPNEDVSVEEFEKTDELSGKMDSDPEEQKLMHSVMENDEQTIEDGHLIQDALNNGVGNFTPDMLFEKLVKNYEEVEELYGETILREITGFEPSQLERNIRIPEFKRMLKEEMTKRLKKLQERGVLDRQYGLTDQSFLLAALVLVKDELDHLLATGFGQRDQREKRDELSDDITVHKRAYKNFDLAKTLAIMAKRGHKELKREDIRFHDHASEGKIDIVYALDASGSMKGVKLALAKRAGVALAYKAIENGDNVGLLAFGSGTEVSLAPSKRFMDFVQALVTLKAKAETNIAHAITAAAPMLHGESKHLVLLTDGLHTTGTDEEVLAAAQDAHDQGISISIIGINLDKQGEELSEKIIDITQGRFYRVQNLQEMDLLILEDYARLKR